MTATFPMRRLAVSGVTANRCVVPSAVGEDHGEGVDIGGEVESGVVADTGGIRVGRQPCGGRHDLGAAWPPLDPERHDGEEWEGDQGELGAAR